ncbi:MAG TPA: 4-hydroxy-3-methylbut-2-enyl diphosphate reductase [Candidatus Moranbacteria bacterium]|nr:4-hydroxy-3-methylbut-2-enyl diphosphate reductase [Candidatus Moranbacteria bacterium]
MIDKIVEITLSQYAGFCEGVERAYAIVEKTAKDSEIKRPVFVLGSLVHNDDVVKKIEEMGIKKLSVDSNLMDFLASSKSEIGTLIITAHGIGPEIYEFAKKNKIDIIDTTCPKVIKVQRLARNFSKKEYQLVIIGEKNHKEVKGIYEWSNKKAFIVENVKDLRALALNPEKSIAVISQTTQDREFFDKSAKYIAEKYPQAEIINSICLTTHDRQIEIKELARKNDIVIVIGSPKSANSNRLWEIAKYINSKTYFIEREDGLKESWFADCGKVAIAAGASTPKRIIEEVTKKIKSMGDRRSNN